MQRGRCMSGGCAIILGNGECVVTAADCDLVVYSARTGESLSRLHGHDDQITALALHTSNVQQVLTASYDGTVKHWDILDSAVLSSTYVGPPIHGLVAPGGQRRIYLQTESDSTDKPLRDRRIAIKHFSLDSQQLEPASLILKSNVCAPAAVSCEGEYVGFADGQKLMAWATNSGWDKRLQLHHTRHLTCLAIDTRGSSIAAGDVSGRILLWHGLRTALAELQAGREARPMGCSTMHWHSHPVACLNFTLDSAYLLSGGQEAVLVAWLLGSGNRKFLPRLSGHLAGLALDSSDPGRVLIIQQDKCLRLVNLASMQVTSSIHSLGWQEYSNYCAQASALVPNKGVLVFTGPDATLHFHDISSDMHVGTLRVIPQTTDMVLRKQVTTAAHIPAPTVDFIAFSRDGSLMATVDQQPQAGDAEEESLSYQFSLKLWGRRTEEGPLQIAEQYQLLNIVSAPHRSAVTGLEFHPWKHLAASIAMDGQLRFWEPSQKSCNGQSTEFQWHCRSISDCQGSSMHSLSFSSDGTLLATGTAGSICLWNVETGALISRLPSPFSCEVQFQYIAFIHGTPHLAGGAVGRKEALVLWNFLTATVSWWTPLSVTALSTDASRPGQMAVGIEANRCNSSQRTSSISRACVATYHVTDPCPAQVWYLPQSRACALMFLGHDTPKDTSHTTSLLILTAQQTLAVVDAPCTQSRCESIEGSIHKPSSVIQEVAKASFLYSKESHNTKDFSAWHDNVPTHWISPLTSMSTGFCESALHCA